MPDLFDSLSLIAANGVAQERADTGKPSARPNDDAVPLALPAVDRPNVPVRRRLAARRPRLIGWSR